MRLLVVVLKTTLERESGRYSIDIVEFLPTKEKFVFLNVMVYRCWGLSV